jgi:hypothetical protein
LFFVSCTDGSEVSRDVPGITVVDLPPELSAGPLYGITLMHLDDPRAAEFLKYVLAPEGQAIFLRHGLTGA